MLVIIKKLIAEYQEQSSYQFASIAAMLLGDLYYDQNDYQNAKDAYIWASKLDGTNTYCFYKLGIAMIDLGRYEIAIER